MKGYGITREKISANEAFTIVELYGLICDWRRFAYVCRKVDRIKVRLPDGKEEERLVPSLRKPGATVPPYVYARGTGCCACSCVVTEHAEAGMRFWDGFPLQNRDEAKRVAARTAANQGLTYDTRFESEGARRHEQPWGLYRIHKAMKLAHLQALSLMEESGRYGGDGEGGSHD